MSRYGYDVILTTVNQAVADQIPLHTTSPLGGDPCACRVRNAVQTPDQVNSTTHNSIMEATK